MFRQKGYPFAFRCMRIYAKGIHIFLLAPVRLKYPIPLMPAGAYVICPNHSSFLDIPCIYATFSKYFTFVGKKEISKWPLFRIFYTSGMNVLVDRSDKSAAGIAFKRMLTEVDLGHPLVIFPEGTISKRAPELGDFKDGAFRIAVQKQIPIVPVTFVTNYKRMERKGFFSGFASPGYCEMVVHTPVSTLGKTRASIPELKEQVRRIIGQPFQSFSDQA